MNHSKHPHKRMPRWLYGLLGLGSLIWLLLRSGLNPRRLTYPCQRAALANSLAFLAYLGSLLGLDKLRRVLRHKVVLSGTASFALLALLAVLLTYSQSPPAPVVAGVAALPGWTSPTAISDVFVVENVPVPECSLDGGALPATAPCDDPNYALPDSGVDQLISEMEAQAAYFYRTASHPTGIVASNDVVVIKVNNQWGEAGSGNGWGRLSTNTDVLKGLLWRILQHPDGFTGEIVIVENTQSVHPVWDDDPANAEDQGQSYQDVVTVFTGLGYPVSLYSWDALNGATISGGTVGGGYPTGEYINGNLNDAYILLEDPAGTGTDELAYPKFQTDLDTYISMRYGIWNGSSYDADQLTFINLPVLKRHGMAGATIAWKNYIGFLMINNNGGRFGGWDEMHGFFWGYQNVGDVDYGGIGRQLALVRAADLNIVDAIWVGYEVNYSGDAIRQDVLLTSTDPFAVDWYASEFVLRSLVPSWSEPNSSSAARAGTFRNATRTNQNVAAAVWPGGNYPYIDLLDSYNGDVPSDDEKNQMNVYVVDGSSDCQPLTAVNITGLTIGEPGVAYTFTAEITPLTASRPITYTWDNGGSTSISVRTFEASGDNQISVSVSNACSGPLTANHSITIIQELEKIYLPLIRR
jgi:hypothetical protein